jgi:hypothetical protein
MSRLAGMTRRLCRYLAQRLGRLNALLSDLTCRLRAAVAFRVADNVAGVVREAVEDLLADTMAPYQPPASASHNPMRRWDDADDGPRFASSIRAGPFSPSSPRWADDDEPRRFPPLSRRDLFGGDSDEPDDDHDHEPIDDEDADGGAVGAQPASDPPALSRPPQLHAALALGLQAGAWYLCRRQQGSLLTALAVGASAGAVALLGGPLVTAGTATLGSLLALTG